MVLVSTGGEVLIALVLDEGEGAGEGEGGDEQGSPTLSSSRQSHTS